MKFKEAVILRWKKIKPSQGFPGRPLQMCLILCVCYTLPGHHWPQISNGSLNHALWNGCQGLNLAWRCIFFHGTVLTKPRTNMHKCGGVTKNLRSLDFCRKYGEMVTNGWIWVELFPCKSRKISPIYTVTIITFKIFYFNIQFRTFIFIICLTHIFSRNDEPWFKAHGENKSSWTCWN